MDSVLINNTESEGLFLMQTVNNTLLLNSEARRNLTRLHFKGSNCATGKLIGPHFRFSIFDETTNSFAWLPLLHPYGKRPGGHLPGYAVGLEANWDI